MRFPDKHTTRDKQLRRLERESHRLYRVTRDAPLVALDHPYQRGWVKTLALRDDITRRADSAAFRNVLAVVNRRLWSREFDFLDRHGQTRMLRPRIIGVGDWRRLAWPASHTRLFSLGHWRDEDEGRVWRRGSTRLTFGYQLTCAWAFVEIIQPHFVTHVRVELPEVRERLAEIEAFFTHHEGRYRLSRLHGYSWRYWSDPNSPAQLRADAALADACDVP